LQAYTPVAVEPSNSGWHAIPALAATGAAIATPLEVALCGSQLEGRRKEDHHMELREKADLLLWAGLLAAMPE
jgi:hypothetical protein